MQFKAIPAVMPQCVHLNGGAAHILNADISAAAVSCIATLEPVCTGLHFQKVGTDDVSGVGGDFRSENLSGSFSYCKHCVPP